MQADIHPSYNNVTATCSCGQKFSIYSTLEKDLHLDICSQCHPFYTGKHKIVDTAGRVERFKARFKRAGTKGKEQKEQDKE